MQLKRSIFLWVFPAAAVPIAVMVLLATAYSEHLYRKRVNQEVFRGIDHIITALDRRLLVEHDLVRGLAGVPAMEAYVPVLAALARGERLPDYGPRTERLNRFLETFQSVRLSLNTVRVLDVNGNTLIKVRSGDRVPAAMEGFGQVPFVEEFAADRDFAEALEELFPGDVGSLLLPEGGGPDRVFFEAPVMNTALAIQHRGETVGYFTVDAPSEQLNRILDVAPRAHGGDLLIAEVNPEKPGRDGMVLYDDRAERNPLLPLQDPRFLGDLYPELQAAVPHEASGVLPGPGEDRRIYYKEYLPYPDRLVSWIIALRVDQGELATPFHNIRMAMVTSLVLALVVSLLLARLGARRIAAPVLGLAAGLDRFARGERGVRVDHGGPDEVGRAGAAFNAMVETLERTERDRDEAQRAMLQSAKLASIGEMAAGIGHEINNPLGNILSLAKLVERELPPEPGPARADVVAIREEAERASRIVRGILNFSRQVPPHTSRFPAGDWLRETLELVAREADKRNLDLRLEADPGVVLDADRDLLRQALVNLLLNALQASPEGGTVAVAAHAAGDELRVSVRDQGPGIPEAELGQVFDPFFSTKPEGQGSGLGLSIALGIVQHHGGELRLGPAPGGGTLAEMVLPLAGVAAEDAG